MKEQKKKKKPTEDGKDEEHLTTADAFTLGASTKYEGTKYRNCISFNGKTILNISFHMI